MKNRLFCTALTVFASTVSTPAWTQETPSVPLRGGGMPSGRSAKMAARLKYYPPNNYLKHYLGDDRYKIAGGVWKVVSTQLDTYYHRPTCPNILRQHADIVIGFSHSKDAEEAGYRADSVCRPQEVVVLYGQAQSALTGYLAAPTRLTLADGSSKVTVPTGWARLISTSAEAPNNIRYYVDAFMPRGGKQKDTVVIVTASVPGVNMEAALTSLNPKPGEKSRGSNMAGSEAQRLEQFRAGMAATNPTGRGELNWLAMPKRGKWAGTNAYFGKMGNIPVVYGARGTKFYLSMGPDSGGALTLRNSFRPE